MKNLPERSFNWPPANLVKKIFIEKHRLNDYENSILKPINNYALRICPPPKFVDYDTNHIVLRQHTYGEIWIKNDLEENFYKFVSRPAIQQFDILADIKVSKDFHPLSLRWQIQWYIDDDIDVVFKTSNSQDKFICAEQCYNFKKEYDDSSDELVPKHIGFLCKKNEKFEEDGYEIINRLIPAFDIYIPYSETRLNRIRDFYANNKFLPIDGSIC